MVTVFERIPEIFIEIYDAQFQTWSREYQTRGTRCAIVFNPTPGAQPIYDEGGRIVAAGAWLTAELDLSASRRRIIIRPATEHDEEMIARHVRAMKPHVLQ